MFQESHGFDIGHGEFTHVAGDYHQHNTNYAPGVPVNNIGSVTNANFGTNYGTIHQTSGASSPSPPHGGYPGYYGPPGGYWPPPSRPYSEPPPPHHGSPYYPPGGYWDGPPPRRQGPPSGPHPPPPRQQQGYQPQQNWNQEVRSEQYGYPDSQAREGPSDRPPVPSQQRPPPNQRGYNDQPQQRRQQQQFNHEESRGSRGPSPAPQSDNRYPGGPQRGYSAPAANPAPNRRETFDDIYGSDYSNTPPPPESQNQPSSSKTKYRTPQASVDSDSDTEMDVEDTQYRLGNLHLSLTATDLTPVQAPKEKGKRGFMGLGKSKKAPA